MTPDQRYIATATIASGVLMKNESGNITKEATVFNFPDDRLLSKEFLKDYMDAMPKYMFTSTSNLRVETGKTRYPWLTIMEAIRSSCG
jgi:hypothetical protein